MPCWHPTAPAAANHKDLVVRKLPCNFALSCSQAILAASAEALEPQVREMRQRIQERCQGLHFRAAPGKFQTALWHVSAREMEVRASRQQAYACWSRKDDTVFLSDRAFDNEAREQAVQELVAVLLQVLPEAAPYLRSAKASKALEGIVKCVYSGEGPAGIHAALKAAEIEVALPRASSGNVFLRFFSRVFNMQETRL